MESFYKFCESIGGATADVMCKILAFEADRRSFNITINSFGTELTRDQRVKLYPSIGVLHPEGHAKLAECSDYDEVQRVAEYYPEFRQLFEGVGTGAGDKTLEDKFFQHEVKLNVHSFMQQFHYGVFYSYVKLKEQESRNIVWVSECISQKQKSKIDNYINIF